MDLRRREAVQVFAAIVAGWLATPAARALAATADGSANTVLDQARLLRFMERLTGFDFWDATFARWMLGRLSAEERARLGALVAAAEAWPAERFTQETASGALAEFSGGVLRLCFTGKAIVDGKPVYVDYLQALAWRAAGIKPGTMCDPLGFGGWSSLPEPV